MKNPLELVDFFIAFACINYSYMVQYIREKIEINPKEPRYLKVVWGLGYKVENI